MDPIEKLEKAKAKLMLEHPYIGSVSTILKLDGNRDTLTFSSDGIHLKYNDEYFEKVPVEDIEFALANGAMHAVLRHSERAEERVGRIWQAASDLVVNAMLVKNGFELPPYVYYDERFEGMYAEEIYDVLKDEMITNDARDEAEAEDEMSQEPEEQQHKSEESQKGSTHERAVQQASMEKNEAAQMEEEGEALQEMFEQIFQKYKRQGELPKELQRLVPEYFSHQINWREILYRYIASYAKNSYSFMPPNMKYLYRGICLPSLTSDLLRVVIAVDTSGSVDETLLGIFLGEVNTVMQHYPNYEIDLITADAKIRSHRVYLPGEFLAYEVSGGGGTDFRPVFEYIDKNIDYPTLLLYFTDGMGTFPSYAQGYDVLWVMPEEREVPFGEVLVLEGGN